MKKRKVYLDYAATTPVYPEVVLAMAPYWQEKFGNPSSVHFWGQQARLVVDQARAKTAAALGAEPLEIIFTPTTSFSANLAIQGMAKAAWQKDSHLITSAIEHHAVLDTFESLKKEGFQTTFLPVNCHGEVDLGVLEKAISKKTILVSIMYANNEVGTTQPLKEIAKIIKEKEKKLKTKIYFHTDAAAAVGWLNLKVNHLGVDALTLGAHKFGGPKGVGVLYLKKGTLLKSLFFGGHQEKGLAPGTEAVPLIVGLSKALEISLGRQKSIKPKVEELRDRLIRGVLRIPNVRLTGHPQKRLTDIASFIIEGVEGEALLLYLSDKGIAASSGSACTSGQLKPSHVLLAMGIAPQLAHGSLRFSLGPETTREEIDYVVKTLPGIVERLRKMRKGIR